jgi:hypothetical protein
MLAKFLDRVSELQRMINFVLTMFSREEVRKFRGDIPEHDREEVRRIGLFGGNRTNHAILPSHELKARWLVRTKTHIELMSPYFDLKTDVRTYCRQRGEIPDTITT